MTQSNAKIKQNFWLVKFAPFRTDWSEVIRRGIFTMRGVRSPEARNNLRDMHKGDQAIFYRSQRDPAVMGLMEVIRPAYPDPTSVDPQWLTCDFRPIRTLPSPIPLAQLKSHPALADLPLIRRVVGSRVVGSRLGWWGHVSTIDICAGRRLAGERNRVRLRGGEVSPFSPCRARQSLVHSQQPAARRKWRLPEQMNGQVRGQCFSILAV